MRERVNRLGDDLIIEDLLRDGPPWDRTLEKLVKDDAECPDIAAYTIDILLESLGWHVDWRANVVILMIVDVVDRNGKSEVTILINSIFVEDVGRLDVTVQVACLVDVEVSRNKLPHYLYCLEVRDGLALLKEGVEVTFAELGDEVCIVASGVYVVEVEYMFGLCE